VVLFVAGSNCRSVSRALHILEQAGPNAVVGTSLCQHPCFYLHSSNQYHHRHDKSGHLLNKKRKKEKKQTSLIALHHWYLIILTPILDMTFIYRRRD